MSLDHSEGSILSEDALDTEDYALDTGDDLDVSIDEQDTPEAAEIHGQIPTRGYKHAYKHKNTNIHSILF